MNRKKQRTQSFPWDDPRGPRKARLEASLSLTAVAKAMGYSPPYLSDLERGNRRWNTELVRKFNQAIKTL
jgi:predicted transcriptional regulator